MMEKNQEKMMLKKQTKGEQSKSKGGRRKEIIKIRAKINAIKLAKPKFGS